METQTRRLLSPIVRRFRYFSSGEDRQSVDGKQRRIYDYDNKINPTERGLKVHNIGHATTLIQSNGFNVLTDPVFGHLNPLLYPSKTRPGVDPIHFPHVDAIVISHAHRDHLDADAIKLLLARQPGEDQPEFFVPAGLADTMRRWGCKKVTELNWNEQAILSKEQGSDKREIVITATPSNHWSNRGLFDKNKSAVNGYLITPKKTTEEQTLDPEAGMVYFAGDTAVMDGQFVKEIATVAKLQMAAYGVPPRLINLEPGGPNYSRATMKGTHQSTMDSLLSAFKLAREMAALEAIQPSGAHGEPLTKMQWWKNITTVFVHHNKYGLGPDRFNENLEVVGKMLNVLTLPTLTIQEILTCKVKKGVLVDKEGRSLKGLDGQSIKIDDFILKGAQELLLSYIEFEREGAGGNDFNLANGTPLSAGHETVSFTQRKYILRGKEVSEAAYQSHQEMVREHKRELEAIPDKSSKKAEKLRATIAKEMSMASIQLTEVKRQERSESQSKFIGDFVELMRTTVIFPMIGAQAVQKVAAVKAEQSRVY